MHARQHNPLPEHVAELDRQLCAANYRDGRIAQLRYEWCVTNNVKVSDYARAAGVVPSTISRSIKAHQEKLEGHAAERGEHHQYAEKPWHNRSTPQQRQWRRTGIQTYLLLGYQRKPIARALDTSANPVAEAIANLGGLPDFGKGYIHKTEDPPTYQWWNGPIDPELYEQASRVAATLGIQWGNAHKHQRRQREAQIQNPNSLRITEIVYAEQLLERIVFERWDSALANTIERAIWDGETQWVGDTYELFKTLAFRFRRLAEVFENEDVRADRKFGQREDAPNVNRNTQALRATIEKTQQSRRQQLRVLPNTQTG
jgi:hypothetical protein